MNTLSVKFAAIALAVPGLALATPAAAAASPSPIASSALAISHAPIAATVDIVQHHRGRHKGWKRGRGNPHRYSDNYRGRSDYRERRYDQPIRRDTRIWRGRDGRYYCKRDNGTTGLLIGAAVGGLVGNELAGRGDRTLGAILGAAGGAILGRTIDRSGSRCR